MQGMQGSYSRSREGRTLRAKALQAMAQDLGGLQCCVRRVLEPLVGAGVIVVRAVLWRWSCSAADAIPSRQTMWDHSRCISVVHLSHVCLNTTCTKASGLCWHCKQRRFRHTCAHEGSHACTQEPGEHTRILCKALCSCLAEATSMLYALQAAGSRQLASGCRCRCRRHCWGM